MTSPLYVLGLVSLLYALALVWPGFEYVAPLINVLRAAAAVAILTLYLPTLRTIVAEPWKTNAERARDLLLVGNIFIWTSAIFFVGWNEIGRRIGAGVTPFTSPVQGFSGVLMVIGALYTLAAFLYLDDGHSYRVRLAWAVVAGVMVASLLFLPAAFGM